MLDARLQLVGQVFTIVSAMRMISIEVEEVIR
jgi:hypothetical protein